GGLSRVVQSDDGLGARSDPVFDVGWIDAHSVWQAIGEVDGCSQCQCLAAPGPDHDARRDDLVTRARPASPQCGPNTLGAVAVCQCKFDVHPLSELFLELPGDLRVTHSITSLSIEKTWNKRYVWA